MTRKQNLEALHDKVAAERWENDGTAFDLFGVEWLHCFDAYHGSLDAAKALHDAVLPGWGWETSHLLKAQVYHMECYSPIFGAQLNNPARAWLLAILAALIQMEVDG